MLIASIAALLGAGATVGPVRADSPSTQTKSSSSGAGTQALQKKVLAATVTTVVGTPICFARRFKHAEIDGIHGFAGDSNKQLAVYSAGAIWLPFALAVATMEAPFYALKDSWYNFDSPFSKEQFSLGEMVGADEEQ